METEKLSRSTSWEENFVSRLITNIQRDKGLSARLRRADNPATEYQSWEFLAGFGIDLEQEHQRLAFTTVAAAIARAKAERNGSQNLGQAIAACYNDGNQSDQAKAKLRRILACDDVAELCRIIRPVLTLIDSRGSRPLDYVRLLQQLRRFTFDAQRIKAQWAQEFYGHSQDEQEAT